MTWAELGKVIDNMSQEERDYNALCFDYETGEFFEIYDCTEYDPEGEPGTDFSCGFNSTEGWR